MSKKDLFGDDVQGDTRGDKRGDTHDGTGGGTRDDFARMLEASMGDRAGKRARTGDVFQGEILSIGKEEAFVSTGTAIDGALPVRELWDENKQLKYKVGDVIDVKVVRAREGEILLKRAGSLAAAEGMDNLEDAFDMELPLEGRVLEAVKGGFRVQIQGQKAFCPISQIDARFVQDPAPYVGQKFEFIITQFEERGRNVVVSRRKLLDLQRAENEGEFLNRHKPGDLMSGEVTRIEKYGAFVRLDSGLEGLVPISELAWGRVNDPAEIVHIGQKVQTALVRANEDDGGRLKISLSLKQAGGEGDPWLTVPEKFPLGAIAEGKIERKESYGLFVNLAPGITGLMPRSKWRDVVDGQQYDNKRKGENVIVQVDEIDLESKRLTLIPPEERLDMGWRQHHAAAAPGKGLGTFGDLLKGFKPQKK